MGAGRNVALNELNFRGIVTVTADTTVVASDSGVLMVAGGTANLTFTLPAVADCKGKMFMFVNLVNYNMTIAGATSVIVALHNAAAASVAFSTTSEKIGGAFLIIGDGTYYYAFNFSAGANMVTVAS